MMLKIRLRAAALWRFMMKKFLALMSAGLGTALLLTACGHIGNITPDSKVKLNPNKPVSLTVWHYYNGAQQAA